MTEDEIGKQVIDVETTIDSLALLASWRENLSSLPANSADEPNEARANSVPVRYPAPAKPCAVLDMLVADE
jgi:hypothetical protein